MNKSIVWKSFLHALGTFLYVLLISWWFSAAQHFLGNKPDNFLMPVLMLLLFLFSACVTGILVLGRPIYFYLEGRKKESLLFLFSTLGWIFVFLLGVGIVLLSI